MPLGETIAVYGDKNQHINKLWTKLTVTQAAHKATTVLHVSPWEKALYFPDGNRRLEF
jgi:hypothetical protein